jgi:V/A-type H+-transporting ATPase subunit E
VSAPTDDHRSESVSDDGSDRRPASIGAPATQGVDRLIGELRRKGVEQGQTEAARIVEEAERRAHFVLEQALLESEQLREAARADAERVRATGEDALRKAARDLVLDMKDTLHAALERDLMMLVRRQFDDQDFLARMLIALVAESRERLALDEIDALLVEFPDRIGDRGRAADRSADDDLGRWLSTRTGETLREGVTFRAGPGDGIRLRWADEQMELTLDAEALGRLLLEHVQPRFRAMLDAIWRA